MPVCGIAFGEVFAWECVWLVKQAGVDAFFD